jgi:hypothetical protein
MVKKQSRFYGNILFNAFHIDTYSSVFFSEIKKQASFNGEAHLPEDAQRTLSRKLSRSQIEHPQLSPVQEEPLSKLNKNFSR